MGSMDSNLVSLIMAVLIHWSGARCLIQQRDLDLALLVARIALHDRARARATRRYLVNEGPTQSANVIAAVADWSGRSSKQRCFNIE